MFHALLRRRADIHQHVYLFVTLVCSFYNTFAIAEQLSSRTIIPAPIVVPPSNDWDGNDGPWSSFTVQIGTPPQNVNTFISTASIQTWAVDPSGCTTTDPTDCAKDRGRLYNNSASTTWVPNLANASTQIYDLSLESSLGYTGKGRYGFDNVTLGYIGNGGPSLQNQTVASIAAKDFFLGLFGVKPRASNFTSFDEPIPSFMQNLRSQSMIPSTSWAYTAGNQYRFNEVLGSLVLGGYDSSKYIPNDLTFGFGPEDDRELIVQLQQISATGTTSPTLLSSAIPMFIDSTVPHIWLPLSVCELFESAFGLTWDPTTELYLLNNAEHTNLQSLNPNITFTLGNLTSQTTVDIVLPYAAFDLTASYPIVENSTKYFPLKRANDSSQYTLGRTFFQEAYVIADYDRRNFSISQCKWDATATENIVAILPPSNSSSAGNSSSSSSSPTLSHNTNIAAIAGGAGGGLILIICIACLIFFFRKKKAKTARAELEANAIEPEGKPELDGAAASAPEKKIYEMPPDGDVLDGGKWMPGMKAVEIGTSGRNSPVYEMAAEEVAFEMSAWEREKEREKEKERRISAGKRGRGVVNPGLESPGPGSPHPGEGEPFLSPRSEGSGSGRRLRGRQHDGGEDLVSPQSVGRGPASPRSLMQRGNSEGAMKMSPRRTASEAESPMPMLRGDRSPMDELWMSR